MQVSLLSDNEAGEGVVEDDEAGVDGGVGTNASVLSDSE
jgi:hypothetical protein